MKKLLVLFVALAVASTAFAADISFSWDTDFGWVSNFDDTYVNGIDELELGIDADIDEYNSFSTEFDGNGYPALVVDGFTITTDLGAYLGLSGIGLEMVNGINGPEGEEYSDFGNVGLASNGYGFGLNEDATVDLNFDFGTVWASAAANWNLGVDDSGHAQEMLFLLGSTSLVEGLSFEAGVQIGKADATSGAPDYTLIGVDAAYTMEGLTVGGSFGTETESESQGFGAGALYELAIDDMTSADASVSFAGDDVEAFRTLGGGVSLMYGDFGVDADFQYNMVDSVSDGLDVSGYVNIGAVKYRVGYMTDANWSNNANGAAGDVASGVYMVVTADF